MRISSLVGAVVLVAACTSSEPAASPTADTNADPAPVAKAPPPPLPSAPIDAAVAVEAPPDASAPDAATKVESKRTQNKKDRIDDAAIAEAIQNKAIVAVLTGESGANGRYGMLSGTGQGSSLDDAISHAKSRAATSEGKRVRGSGSLNPDFGSTGPATKPAEDTIISRSKLGGVDSLDKSSLTPDSVSRRVRGKYLAGMKRCHQKLLKKDPRAAGKVNFNLTVGATGRVSKTAVQGFDPTMDQCLKGLSRAWRFEAPKDDSGQPVSASFKFPMLFKPGS